MINNFYVGHYDYEIGFVRRTDMGAYSAISVQGSYSNDAAKTIKYVDIEMVPYNAVNDRVAEPATLRITGPIAPGKSTPFIGKDLWYDPSITTVKVAKTDITYMDNSASTLAGQEGVRYLPSAKEESLGSKIGSVLFGLFGIGVIIGLFVLAIMSE
ncbi:MAG: hypothetical protein E7324_02990 [Clostridiales bacterium]|nr:hypothetical protein [Clostridiales bacterium]